MKKLAIALVAFSIVFTGCAVAKSDGESDLKVSVESVETPGKSADDLQELLGEFDVLVHGDYDFSKLSYKSAETTKNLTIETIVKDTFFSDKENPEYNYTYNYTNLNDDEFDDMIVLLGGMEFAGSGGSTVLILKGEADENYTLINKVTLARTPIIVTNTLSNGYRDLLFIVYGGGSETHHNILSYDGIKYPINPSTQSEAESGRVFEGDALIANTEYYKNLIKAGLAE